MYILYLKSVQQWEKTLKKIRKYRHKLRSAERRVREEFQVFFYLSRSHLNTMNTWNRQLLIYTRLTCLSCSTQTLHKLVNNNKNNIKTSYQLLLIFCWILCISPWKQDHLTVRVNVQVANQSALLWLKEVGNTLNFLFWHSGPSMVSWTARVTAGSSFYRV